MNPETLNSHLATMDDSQRLDLLLFEVKNARNLHKRSQSKLPERNTYNARNDGKQWQVSEQYENSKERIRVIAKHLI